MLEITYIILWDTGILVTAPEYNKVHRIELKFEINTTTCTVKQSMQSAIRKDLFYALVTLIINSFI